MNHRCGPAKIILDQSVPGALGQIYLRPAFAAEGRTIANGSRRSLRSSTRGISINASASGVFVSPAVRRDRSAAHGAMTGSSGASLDPDPELLRKSSGGERPSQQIPPPAFRP